MTAEAAEQYESLPLVVKVRVLKVFERLRAWPKVSGAKPLRARLAGSFRIRTGDHRVQFRPEHGVVLVEKIGHRARFYEGG